MGIRLERVQYMPKELKPDVLYVAEEFGAAAHLCACGCGAKIRTPLGPTEWSLEETPNGPSLYPSVGNWQQACKSHYWIHRGEIRWAFNWTPAQVEAGRRREEVNRNAYYSVVDGQRGGIWQRGWRWISSVFKS
tara:strand:- start:2959 stop:3360 length:402 start_codon:yes stop_codon:yes gene_type:complete